MSRALVCLYHRLLSIGEYSFLVLFLKCLSVVHTEQVRGILLLFVDVNEVDSGRCPQRLTFRVFSLSANLYNLMRRPEGDRGWRRERQQRHVVCVWY